MRNFKPWMVVAGATMVLFAGCGGGSGQELDSNGRPVGEGADPSGPMTASLSLIHI